MPSKQFKHTYHCEKTAHHISKYAARRLFLGNLPTRITEQQVQEVFLQNIRKALVPEQPNYETLRQVNHIFGVYLSELKGYDSRCGFIEFTTEEMCTACLIFDRVALFGNSKPVVIKRSDYFNHNKQQRNKNIPLLRLPSSLIPAPFQDSVNQIFVGGIPFNLTRDQAFMLLEPIGEVKTFHMPASTKKNCTNNGYFFCEFVDESLAPKAIEALDGFISPITQGRYLNACYAKERDVVKQDTLKTEVALKDKELSNMNTSSEELWPMLPQRPRQITSEIGSTPPKQIRPQIQHSRSISPISSTSISSIASLVSFNHVSTVPEILPPPPPGFTQDASSSVLFKLMTGPSSQEPLPHASYSVNQKMPNMDFDFGNAVSTSCSSLLRHLELIANASRTEEDFYHVPNLSILELDEKTSIGKMLSTESLNESLVMRGISAIDPLLCPNGGSDGVQTTSQIIPVVEGDLLASVWGDRSRPPSPYDVIKELQEAATDKSMPFPQNGNQTQVPKTIRRPSASGKKCSLLVQFELLEDDESLNDEALEMALRGLCIGFGQLENIHISRKPDGAKNCSTNLMDFHNGFLL